jgi:phosphoribosylcarboxyaminoimidazole (NCAIR) mutase
MSQPEARRASVVIVLGPGVQDEVVEHTRKVLNHYGILFQEVGWRGLPDLLAGGARGLGVIVFATGVSYTDEHIRLPEEVIVPVIRVVTDSVPPPGQLLTGTALVASVGYGATGAVNAGIFAAQILAVSDNALRDLLKTKPYPVP